MPVIFILALFLILPAAPAFAGVALAFQDDGWIFALHLILNIFALWRIWRADLKTTVWRVLWSVFSLGLPIVGPVFYLGLSRIPAAKWDRSSNPGSFIGGFVYSTAFGGGAAGIPSVARIIDGELDPDEPAPQSHLAMEYLRQAQDGDPQAQTHYGTLLEYGDNVKPDPRAAAGWYRKAADQGFAAAQARLGDLYSRGLGVAQSAEEACFWLSIAARSNPKYAERRDGHAAKLTNDARDRVAARVRDWKAGVPLPA